MFSTNVTGLIHMTQAILPIFKARNPPSGDIINIGSIAGREPYQGGSIYCATKAAVRSFTDAMRKELIATRIRIMEIDPGQVQTEFSVVRFGGDREKADKVYEGVEPLTPDDIAEVVVFAAGRRENVVLADSLIFPNHQVSVYEWERRRRDGMLMLCRLLRRLCTENQLVSERQTSPSDRKRKYKYNGAYTMAHERYQELRHSFHEYGNLNIVKLTINKPNLRFTASTTLKTQRTSKQLANFRHCPP
jgi:hypothetical protein